MVTTIQTYSDVIKKTLSYIFHIFFDIWELEQSSIGNRIMFQRIILILVIKSYLGLATRMSCSYTLYITKMSEKASPSSLCVSFSCQLVQDSQGFKSPWLETGAKLSDSEFSRPCADSVVTDQLVIMWIYCCSILGIPFFQPVELCEIVQWPKPEKVWCIPELLGTN